MVGFGPSAAFLVALPAIPLIGAVCCNVHQKAAVHTALNMVWFVPPCVCPVIYPPCGLIRTCCSTVDYICCPPAPPACGVDGGRRDGKYGFAECPSWSSHPISPQAYNRPSAHRHLHQPCAPTDSSNTLPELLSILAGLRNP